MKKTIFGVILSVGTLWSLFLGDNKLNTLSTPINNTLIADTLCYFEWDEYGNYVYVCVDDG